MSKSCCFDVVLAAMCLSVILLSLEADAQPTADDTMSCDSSESDDVVNIVKIIASNQQENAKQIKDEIREQIGDVKQLLASNPNQGPNQCVTVEPSKQALVSALECKYITFTTSVLASY